MLTHIAALKAAIGNAETFLDLHEDEIREDFEAENPKKKPKSSPQKKGKAEVVSEDESSSEDQSSNENSEEEAEEEKPKRKSAKKSPKKSAVGEERIPKKGKKRIFLSFSFPCIVHYSFFFISS
jgi:hypothetical protein